MVVHLNIFLNRTMKSYGSKSRKYFSPNVNGIERAIQSVKIVFPRSFSRALLFFFCTTMYFFFFLLHRVAGKMKKGKHHLTLKTREKNIHVRRKIFFASSHNLRYFKWPYLNGFCIYFAGWPIYFATVYSFATSSSNYPQFSRVLGKGLRSFSSETSLLVLYIKKIRNVRLCYVTKLP